MRMHTALSSSSLSRVLYLCVCSMSACILVCAPWLHRTTNLYIGSRQNAQRVLYLLSSTSLRLHINPLSIAELYIHSERHIERQRDTVWKRTHSINMQRQRGRWYATHTLWQMLYLAEWKLPYHWLCSCEDAREREEKKHCINGSSNRNCNSNSDGMITEHVVCEFSRSPTICFIHIQQQQQKRKK